MVSSSPSLGRWPSQAMPFSGGLGFGLLVLFVIVWTAYGAISGLSTAVHHDTVEAYVWGREFQLGYYKHPPFWAWMAGAWFTFAPHQDWAFRLLAMINAAIGLWGSWRLIGNFAGGRTQAAATLLLVLTPFFTFLAYKFNANSIFLSVWPWTLHYFVRSFETRRLRDAMWFGALIGVAFLSKYFAAILAATCLIGALTQPGRRAYFASLAPYISAATAFVVLAPHLWWLSHTGFQTFHYFAAETGRSYGPIVSHALGTIAALVALHILVIAIVAWSSARRQPWALAAEIWRAPNGRMLTVLALAPIAFTVAVALMFRNKISVNMLIGTVSLLPLLLMKAMGASEALVLRRAAIAVAALSLVSLALSPAIALAKMHFSNEPDATQPRAEAAGLVTSLWRSATHTPLTFVAGSEFYVNATAFYSPDHPHVFIDFDPAEAPWVTRAALARNGLLILCEKSDAACLAHAAQFGPAFRVERFTLAHSYGGVRRRPVDFVVFMHAPQTTP